MAHAKWLPDTSSPEVHPASIDSRARQVALVYGLVGIVWVFLSDIAVEALFADRTATFLAQFIKGVAYVAATTALVYGLARLGFRSTGRDILAAQLERSQNLLDTVLANLGEAVIVVDPRVRIIRRCNSAVTTMFGYRESELIGRSSEILHESPGAYVELGRISEAALRNHGVFRGRTRMRRKDGGILETENTIVALDRGLGGEHGLVTIVHDLTERERAEKALRASEERYRLLAEHTLDLIWTLDMDLVFTYVNPAVGTMFGYTPEAFIGTRLEAHCSQRGYADLRRAIADEFAKGPYAAGFIVETEMRRKDGAQLPVEVHGKVLFDLQGRPIGLQGTTRDLSERLAMEGQLRQAQKLEAIGTLASGVAHEINNPITAIAGNADLLEAGAIAPEELRQVSADIKNAAGRIRTIVKNLLGFARKEEVEPASPQPIGAIVDAMLSLVEAALRHDQIDLQVAVPDDLPQVVCRGQQIQQVVMNLLTNARDALNNKYPGAAADKKIVLSARAVERDGRRWVRTTVEDRGPGLADEVRERMFEPFFTTKSAEKGTGLGLWIIYRIVRNHGGRIEVETEPGAFTRFHIDLPAEG